MPLSILKGDGKYCRTGAVRKRKTRMIVRLKGGFWPEFVIFDNPMVRSNLHMWPLVFSAICKVTSDIFSVVFEMNAQEVHGSSIINKYNPSNSFVHTRLV